jgi:hypothetical protein
MELASDPAKLNRKLFDSGSPSLVTSPAHCCRPPACTTNFHSLPAMFIFFPSPSPILFGSFRPLILSSLVDSTDYLRFSSYLPYLFPLPLPFFG